MRITKKDIIKLEIFCYYLNLYLSDWEMKNCFYYGDLRQKDLIIKLINTETLKETNNIYNEFEKEEKNIIKYMLISDRLNFQASKNKPLRCYKFNYIKKLC